MELAIFISILLVSVVVHEVAHGWVARREGDPTADQLGRITLNPIPHIDPIGSIVVPLLLYMSPGNLLFGWAKPVPVNPRYYRDPLWSDIKVSLAGIVANFLLAILFTLVLAVAVRLESTGGPAVLGAIARGAELGIFLNLLLAFFNLIPIPPLDGSHVLAHMLPEAMAAKYRQLGRYGTFVLLGLILLVPGSFSLLLAPVYALMRLADAFVRLWI